MSYRGANTEEVRRLAGELGEILQVVQEAERLLHQLISELPGVWSGADADRMVGELSQIHLPAAVAAKGRLENAVQAIQTNARQQDDTSGRLA